MAIKNVTISERGPAFSNPSDMPSGDSVLFVINVLIPKERIRGMDEVMIRTKILFTECYFSSVMTSKY